MARLDALHWQVEPGQNWATVAAAAGLTRNALLACNGQPKNNPPQLEPGQIVHAPLGGPG